MRSLFVFSLLMSFALSQVLHKFDFDVKKLRYISESPKLKSTLKHLNKKLNHKSEVRPRILNGSPAAPGQFPFHVFLRLELLDLCSGSLIKPNWVLTVMQFCKFILIILNILYRLLTASMIVILRWCLVLLI